MLNQGRFVIAMLLVGSTLKAQDAPMDPAPRLIASIDTKGAHYAELAKQIWSFAEVGYQEV